MIQLILGFLLGITFGSLVKVLADRSLTKQSFWGRSYCNKCKHILAWYDLFPIFSYLFLRGRCRYCKTKLSPEYLLVEVLVGLLTALWFYIKIPGNFFELEGIAQGLLSADLAFGCFVIITLTTVLLTDIKTGLIPDRITFPSIIIAFFYLLVSGITKTLIFYQSLASHELGKYLLPKAPYEYLFLWKYFLPPSSEYFFVHANINFQPFISGVISALGMLIFFATLIIATRGRGMGGGDLKLSIFLGLVFGFPKSLLAVMLGFLLGSVVGIFLLLVRRKHFGQTIPFGPFLSVGGIIALFWGDKILNWYLNLSVY